MGPVALFSDARPSTHALSLRFRCPHKAANIAVKQPAARRGLQPAPRQARTGVWRGRATRCRAAFSPFPFSESDYYRASLQLVQVADGTPGSASQSSGHLLLMRDGPRGIEDTERGLILAVGGDTLSGIALLMQGRDGERPLCLDLLWTVLQRGKELSKRDWRLERVAIVELRGMAYIGRLFFGDGAGGAAWDCDCRPSDGCWLSLKEKCPIYIHRRVWEDNSTPLRDLARKDDAPSPLTQRRGKGGATLGMDGVVLGSDNSLPSQVTSIRDSDPELLKRLKMEMRVALKDEDYATATRLRDHPFMQLHARILTAEKEGAADEVQRLRDELDFTVATYEQTGVLPEVHPSEQRQKRRSTDAEQ